MNKATLAPKIMLSVYNWPMKKVWLLSLAHPSTLRKIPIWEKSMLGLPSANQKK